MLVPADKVLVPTDMRQELGTLYARYKYWYKVQNSCPLAARDYHRSLAGQLGFFFEFCCIRSTIGDPDN